MSKRSLDDVLDTPFSKASKDDIESMIEILSSLSLKEQMISDTMGEKVKTDDLVFTITKQQSDEEYLHDAIEQCDKSKVTELLKLMIPVTLEHLYQSLECNKDDVLVELVSSNNFRPAQDELREFMVGNKIGRLINITGDNTIDAKKREKFAKKLNLTMPFYYNIDEGEDIY